MHPVRQFILFRWALYLLVALGVGGFLLTRTYTVPSFSSDVVKRLTPKKVQLPDPSVTKTLDSAISVLKGERVPFGGVDKVEPSLIALHAEVTATGQRKLPVTITAIFMGPPKQYAIINGAVLGVGEMLPDGRSLKEIQSDGVILAVGDVEERYEWLPPFRVELVKPEVKASRTAMATKPEAAAATTAPSAPQAQTNLENIPENPTPAQALNILQQMKQQKAKK